MEDAMSERTTNTSWFWVKFTGMALVTLSMTTCGGAEPPVDDAIVEPSLVERDVSTLTPEATDEDIMQHMLWVMENQTISTELTQHFPDIDRTRAYDIQRLRLEHREQTEARVGWKIGWSNQPNPRVAIDPVFGHIMGSNVLEPGREVSLDHLIEGSLGLEAEVVFWLDQDLPGPTVTREDVIEAIAEVAPVVELIKPRVAAYDSESLAIPAGGEQPISDWPNRHNHGIIDNVWHIGVIFGSNRVGVDEVDFMNERVSLAVNDETIVEGRFSWTMGRDPIQGVVWLANELLKYGYQLNAGDFVITGSVAYTESVFPGDRATLTYSSLGAIDMSVASTP